MYRTKFRVRNSKIHFLGYSRCFASSFTMTTDIVNEIHELNHPKVHIKNRERVNELINELANGGTKKLQIVSDFDKTITKQHENGKPHLSSFGIFAHCKTLPESYLESEQLLTNKYLPIENDPDIPFLQKKALMEEWWNLSEKLLLGLTISEKDIEDVVAELGPSLRDGCKEAFTMLHSANVPVLVFSAGLGDTVIAVLKYFGVLLSNVKVVSNFLKRDQDGIVQGFGNKMINIFNKNETALEGTAYYDLIKDRSNVILMGDSMGDAGMADGVPNVNAVLKIGFLYDHVQGNLPAYMDKFDIVLEDDQTMNVLNAILLLINEQDNHKTT